MKPSLLFEVLKIGIPKQRAFLLKSPPGLGKTDIGKQSAEAVNYETQIFHPVIDDPTDYKGMPWIYVPEESSAPSAEFIPFGNLKRILEAKVPTLAFLDDLGQAPELVQAATMQMLLARRINDKPIPDHVTFLAATNERGQRMGVRGILEPVKSRFKSIIELEVDPEDWQVWAINHSIPVVVRAFIRWKPELLHQPNPTGDITNYPSPRTVAHVGELYGDKYPSSVRFELYSGSTGEEWTTEFIGFEKIFRKLPNPKLIIQDPMKYQLPKDPSILYALAGALANLSSPDVMPNIVTICNRLKDPDEFDDSTARNEFAVLLIRDSVIHDPEVQDTRAYIEWESQNPSVVF